MIHVFFVSLLQLLKVSGACGPPVRCLAEAVDNSSLLQNSKVVSRVFLLRTKIFFNLKLCSQLAFCHSHILLIFSCSVIRDFGADIFLKADIFVHPLPSAWPLCPLVLGYMILISSYNPLWSASPISIIPCHDVTVSASLQYNLLRKNLSISL